MPATVNASTIELSTSIFVLLAILPMSIKLPPAFATTNTDYNTRDLLKLATIETDRAKYGGQDDNFTFKLAIFPKTYNTVDVWLESKM